MIILPVVGGRYLVHLHNGDYVGECLWVNLQGDRILMDFDDFTNGHSGGDEEDGLPQGRDDHCWFCDTEDIIEEESPPTVIAKVEVWI